MRIILDSGAIIASERNDATLAAILKAARKDRTPILVPATVVAETWRGASTHARTARLFGSVDGFSELSEQTARRVGTLLAISRTARWLMATSSRSRLLPPVLTDRQRFAAQFIRFKEQQRRVKPQGPVRSDPKVQERTL